MFTGVLLIREFKMIDKQALISKIKEHVDKFYSSSDVLSEDYFNMSWLYGQTVNDEVLANKDKIVEYYVDLFWEAPYSLLKKYEREFDGKEVDTDKNSSNGVFRLFRDVPIILLTGFLLEGNINTSLIFRGLLAIVGLFLIFLFLWLISILYIHKTKNLIHENELHANIKNITLQFVIDSRKTSEVN